MVQEADLHLSMHDLDSHALRYAAYRLPGRSTLASVPPNCSLVPVLGDDHMPMDPVLSMFCTDLSVDLLISILRKLFFQR